jgi:hypothetical protein
MKTKCFYTRDGKHLYMQGKSSCELCGDVKYQGRGLYGINSSKRAKAAKEFKKERT